MRPVTVPARLAVAAAALALAAGVSGCGDDGDDAPSEESIDLTASLGFLVDDLGLTPQEVACVSATMQEEVGDDGDVAGLAQQLRQVDAGEIAVSELPDDADTILTAALSQCAGS